MLAHHPYCQSLRSDGQCWEWFGGYGSKGQLLHFIQSQHSGAGAGRNTWRVQVWHLGSWWVPILPDLVAERGPKGQWLSTMGNLKQQQSIFYVSMAPRTVQVYPKQNTSRAWMWWLGASSSWASASPHRSKSHTALLPSWDWASPDSTLQIN